MEQFFHALWHAIRHALGDSLTLVPFLFLTYLGLELLERHAGEKTKRAVARAGRAGPLLGALLGVVPQCGFSAAGAGLYAGRVITTGTLLAIFWSTSDEMLPLLLMEGAPLGKIIRILAVKVAVGVVAGFAVDLIARSLRREDNKDVPSSISELCRSGHCDCDRRPVWAAALIHTARIALTVFGVCTLLHTVIGLIGEEALGAWMGGTPVLACLLSALVGLIPNCTASVVITTLYLEGVLSAGALFSGLLVGAGVGLLVLFRVNRPVKDTLRVMGILFAVGVAFGAVFDALGLGSILGI